MIKINKKHPFSQGKNKKNTLLVREKTKKHPLGHLFLFFLFFL
jgi:hypothetical protein